MRERKRERGRGERRELKLFSPSVAAALKCNTLTLWKIESCLSMKSEKQQEGKSKALKNINNKC